MHPRAACILTCLAALSLGAATAHLRAQAPPAVPHPDVLEINGVGAGLIPVNGSWQFHLGDNPAWASPALDDSPWEQITVDQPWGAQTHNGYTGFAWYRRHIEFHPAPGADPDIALYMPITRDACEIYWNGQLVGGFGHLPPHAVWYYDSVWPYTVGLGKPTSGVLAIRVWKAPDDAFSDDSSGGLEGPPMAGNPDAVANAKTAIDYQWLRTSEFSLWLDLLYALTAVLSLVAWLRYRRQRILGWMALYAIGPIGALVLDNVPLLVPYRWDYPLLFLSYSCTEIALWYILLGLLGLAGHPRLRRITFVLACLSLGCVAIEGVIHCFNWESGPTVLFQTLDFVATAVSTFVDLYPLVLIPFAFRRRLGLSRAVLAVVAMLNQVVQITPSILSEGIRFTHFHALDPAMNLKLHIADSEIGLQDSGYAILFVTLVYALARSLERSRTRQQDLETEFRSARELQQFLIPATLPAIPGFTLTSAYRPAREVGGDFFLIIPLDPSSTLIVLGDVSGKGLKAAMAVSLIVGAVRSLAAPNSRPGPLLAELNRRLHGSLGGAFATCTALRISSNGMCHLASAGHPAPLRNGREISTDGTLPLGIVPETTYEQVDFRLAPGDSLALYTDGLLEARNPAGELFGFDRLENLFASRPTADEAAHAAQLFGQDDDITVLTLTYKPASDNNDASEHEITRAETSAN